MESFFDYKVGYDYFGMNIGMMRHTLMLMHKHRNHEFLNPVRNINFCNEQT